MKTGTKVVLKERSPNCRKAGSKAEVLASTDINYFRVKYLIGGEEETLHKTYLQEL